MDSNLSDKSPSEGCEKQTSSEPSLTTEEFLQILNLPACKSKGYCDNCGRCER